VAALLATGGPVRVAMRPCCVLALVGGKPPADPELRAAFVCAAAEDPVAGLLETASATGATT
jgi:hypothetical protein